jgi:hypothetical protein
LKPPHTIISLPVHTAVCSDRACGAATVLVDAHCAPPPPPPLPLELELVFVVVLVFALVLTDEAVDALAAPPLPCPPTPALASLVALPVDPMMTPGRSSSSSVDRAVHATAAHATKAKKPIPRKLRSFMAPSYAGGRPRTMRHGTQFARRAYVDQRMRRLLIRRGRAVDAESRYDVIR